MGGAPGGTAGGSPRKVGCSPPSSSASSSQSYAPALGIGMESPSGLGRRHRAQRHCGVLGNIVTKPRSSAQRLRRAEAQWGGGQVTTFSTRACRVRT
eukprot:scaffold5100_cov61-Phaeocystis_antarctica.AAC.6